MYRYVYVITSKLTFRTPELSLKYIKHYSFAYHELKFEGISLIIANRKTKCSVVSGSHSFQCFSFTTCELCLKDLSKQNNQDHFHRMLEIWG